MRAFGHNENQSMLLLSRSNTVLHQFISKIKNGLIKRLNNEDIKWNIKAIRVNSILTTKETAILNHFAECLGMDNIDKQILAHEMQSRMKQYFTNHPEVSVLFIFENVEYYVENSKQSLLYKILDMFQYTQIKFAFIATSQKIDIIDNFEKRIKSRFSHRQILFYSEDLSTFNDCIDDTIRSIAESKDTSAEGTDFIYKLHEFITEEKYGCNLIFTKMFEKGKDYEFLCRTLKIALSHLNSTYKANPLEIQNFSEKGGELFRHSLNYVENLSTSNDFKTILSKMPEAYFAVLIAGKNAFINWKMDYFTFTLAYKEYKCYTQRDSAWSSSKLGAPKHTSMSIKISKETFIKIFIDLIWKGFFKSKSSTDFISVNNKIVLGIEENELHNMIKDNLKVLNLSTSMEAFVENRSS